MANSTWPKSSAVKSTTMLAPASVKPRWAKMRVPTSSPLTGNMAMTPSMPSRIQRTQLKRNQLSDDRARSKSHHAMPQSTVGKT